MSVNNIKNKYQTTKDFMVCWSNNEIDFFIFSKEDYDIIKKYCWYRDGLYFAANNLKNGKIRAHRLILSNSLGISERDVLYCDHIDGNPTNNMRDNLRNVSNQKNSFNKRVNSSSSTGYYGITTTVNGTYAVEIKMGKERRRKTVKNIDDAILIRLKWEKELFGEQFSPQRELFSTYNI